MPPPDVFRIHRGIVVPVQHQYLQKGILAYTHQRKMYICIGREYQFDASFKDFFNRYPHHSIFIRILSVSYNSEYRAVNNPPQNDTCRGLIKLAQFIRKGSAKSHGDEEHANTFELRELHINSVVFAPHFYTLVLPELLLPGNHTYMSCELRTMIYMCKVRIVHHSYTIRACG